MKSPFRQGIVYCTPNFLTINSDSTVSITLDAGESVAITFADGNANYLITETKTQSAWNKQYSSGTDYWLYWDIDVVTGALTYGDTKLAPQVGNDEPQRPLNDQHWFDTTSNQMLVYNSASGLWKRKIRVFSAYYRQSNTLISVSSNSPSFVGSQIGDITPVSAGAIVFDTDGYVLKRGNGTFFTTEDAVTSSIASSALIKLENSVLTATAEAPISKYTVVRFTKAGTITPATNLLADSGIYGIVESDLLPGDISSVIVDGVITIPDWNITTTAQINDPIYVTADGQLTTDAQPSRCVGLVAGTNTILLSNMLVGDVGYIESAITITGPTSGLAVIGADGIKSSTFNISLTDDLKAVEQMSTIGVVKRTGNAQWSAGKISLIADVSDALPPGNGGTGMVSPTGYIKGHGTASATASPTIPASDVVGDIAGRAMNVSGVVSIDHGGTNATTQADAIKNLLPPYRPSYALTNDGTALSWTAIPAGTITSVDVTSQTPNVVCTGGPITTAGDLSINLTGYLNSVARLTSTGLMSASAGGAIKTHNIAPDNSNTIDVANGDGSTAGNITIGLHPLINPGVYVKQGIDQYGRTVFGYSTLDWTDITFDTLPTTIAEYRITDAYTKTQTTALTWNWSSITNTPTTLAGYGITDAYTKTQTNALTWNWSSITNTPTTLAGYGITDSVMNGGSVASIAAGALVNRSAAGQSGRLYIDTTSKLLTYDTGTSWVQIGNVGSVTSVGITTSTPNISVTPSTITSSGSFTLSLNGNLSQADTLTTSGLIARTSSGDWTTRSILGSTGTIAVTNADGNSGNVVVDMVDVGAPGTYCSVTTDNKGRVVSGKQTVDWANIDGRPTKDVIEIDIAANSDYQYDCYTTFGGASLATTLSIQAYTNTATQNATYVDAISSNQIQISIDQTQQYIIMHNLTTAPIHIVATIRN